MASKIHSVTVGGSGSKWHAAITGKNGRLQTLCGVEKPSRRHRFGCPVNQPEAGMDVTCANCIAKMKGMVKVEEVTDLSQRLYEALVLLQEHLPVNGRLIVHSQGAGVYGESKGIEMDGLKETAQWLVMVQE